MPLTEEKQRLNESDLVSQTNCVVVLDSHTCSLNRHYLFGLNCVQTWRKLVLRAGGGRSLYITAGEVSFDLFM